MSASRSQSAFFVELGAAMTPKAIAEWRATLAKTPAIPASRHCARRKLPGAPLLARASGKAWDKDAWKGPIKAAVIAAKLPTATTAYALRHSAITDLIALHKLDTLTVAQLSGTSLQMIERHYGHLLRNMRRTRWRNWRFKETRRTFTRQTRAPRARNCRRRGRGGHPTPCSSGAVAASRRWQEMQETVKAAAPAAEPADLPIGPALPPEFENTANESRSRAELDTRWLQPFAQSRPDGSLDVPCLMAARGIAQFITGTAKDLTEAQEIARTKLKAWQAVRDGPP